MKPLVAVVFGSVLVGLAVTADAQVRYVDENGKSHWVNSASQVPEKYRESSVYKPNLTELKEKNDSTMKPLNTRSSNGPSRVKAAEFEIDQEIERRVEKSIEDQATARNARRAIRECEAYKYRPREMNQEQAAICQRVWADKANRTLGR